MPFEPDPVGGFEPDDFEPDKKPPVFLRPKIGELDYRTQGPLEAGTRKILKGAMLGMDVVPRGLATALAEGKTYQEARRGVADVDRQTEAAAGPWGAPLTIGGGLVSTLAGSAAIPAAMAGLAPVASLLPRSAGLLARMAAGTADAVGVSTALGAGREAGTDKGAAEGAYEGATSPWNALGPLGGALSWLGARARPASQDAAIGYLRPSAAVSEKIDAAYEGPYLEESMRGAGQRAIDLGALKTGYPGKLPEMGQRAAGLDKAVAADTAALDNTIQELNVRGATLDRTQLLTDIKNAILQRFDKPGAAEFTKDMRKVAEEVLQNIANDRDLRSGAPFSNFVTAKRYLQATFEKYKTVAPSAFNDMLKKAERDAARVLREHTEAAAMKADPKAYGPKFKELNQRIHENIPLKEAAEAEALRRAGKPVEPSTAYGATSLAQRVVSGAVLRDTAPYRVALNRALAKLYESTPDKAGQVLVQALRAATMQEEE
jgi:hypothetical protein